MEIHPGLKAVLDNILFWQRYKNIVANNHDFTHRFSSYNNDKVGELIESLGYSVSYNKSENFFKLIEKIPPFQFQFNMMLKSGIIELIWAVRQNDQKMPLGVGSWGSIADFLSSEEKIKNPIFTSYDDLRSILKEAFAIYEDFKRELLNQSISFGNLVYAG